MAGILKLQSSGGGSVTLTATETGTDKVLTFPSVTGSLVLADSATGSALLPSGTTAQRPASPVAGMTRLNTTTNSVELYNGTGWINLYAGSYAIDYLIIGGGGGGTDGNGSQTGGGGGAGGYVTGSMTIVGALAYSVVVGAGHAANTGYGNSSSFGNVIAYAGGRGLSYTETNTGAARGGSGGGAGQQGGIGGYGTLSQGNSGGSGDTYWSGGGGGAGAAGGVANGGNGLSSSITGTAVTRGGGGGGCYTGGGSGSGGSGGGGAGWGGVGVANTGGGGGGGLAGAGAGGSGIVIIRYLGPQRGTGGTLSAAGGYTIHVFTASGTYTA